MDLCLDVIYNTNMKAIGLHHLVLLFIDWEKKNHPENEDEENHETPTMQEA